jgi:hypothetical protein
MPGLKLHQYWRRPVATCTGLPKAIPFERLDPPVPVAISGTISLSCFIVSHLVCTSVARSTPESQLGPHDLQNRSPPRRESRASALTLSPHAAPPASPASAPSLRVDPAVSSSTTANASGLQPAHLPGTSHFKPQLELFCGNVLHSRRYTLKYLCKPALPDT